MRAVETLWSDDQTRRQLGDAARRRVEKCHTWEAAARIALGGLGGEQPHAADMLPSRRKALNRVEIANRQR